MFDLSHSCVRILFLYVIREISKYRSRLPLMLIVSQTITIEWEYYQVCMNLSPDRPRRLRVASGRLFIIILILIILLTMFIVLSSWHSHCESSPSSFDECRLSTGWPPTLRPNQPIWAVSPPKDWLLPSADTIAIYYYHSARKLILIYRPTKGGRLSLPGHCRKGAQPVPKAVYRTDCRDKHDRARWDSNLGPLAPQSGVVPLSHRDLLNRTHPNPTQTGT